MQQVDLKSELNFKDLKKKNSLFNSAKTVLCNNSDICDWWIENYLFSDWLNTRKSLQHTLSKQ